MEAVNYRAVNVVFEYSDRYWWQRRLLKNGFEHCWFFIEAGYPTQGLLNEDCILVANRGSDGLNMDIHWIDPEEARQQCFQNGATAIVRVMVPNKPDGFQVWRFPSCVTYCLDILGLSNRFISTPFQLFNAASKIQGSKIFVAN